MTIKGEAWKNKSKQISKEYRKGYNETFKCETLKCLNCNASVSEGDKECWVCKKELS